MLSDTHIYAGLRGTDESLQSRTKIHAKARVVPIGAYLKSINSGVYLLGGLATWNSWHSVKANASRLGNCWLLRQSQASMCLFHLPG